MTAALRWVAIYYWLTPAFWLIDHWFGANLRTAAFDGHPGWKTLYYLFCMSCGILLWVKPSWTRAVGVTESSLNLLVLLLGFVLPYLRLLDRLAGGADAVDASAFTVERAMSFLLSGLICAFSFYSHAGARLVRV
jgi:hypothetical protein